VTPADSSIGPRAVPPRGTPTPCPPPEDLARFVDGALPDDARARTVAHLVACDDCREMVAMAAEAPAPSTGSPHEAAPRPRIAMYGALALAASVLLAVYVMRPASAVQATDPWSAITDAVGPTRPVEGRLSRVTRHAPFTAPSRSASGASSSFAAEAVAARLADAVTAASTADRAEAAHAAAVAALIAGHPADAVARLDRVVAEAPGSAARLNDLAVAHLALAAIESRVHFAAALEAADEALRLSPDLRAARFNRALALDGLGRAAEAHDAWQAIAADATDDPAWRDDAARRLQRQPR
jgi:tetratricopeptide (TPR) repeat protein